MTSFAITNTFDDEVLDQLVALYQNEWWSKGRVLADVRILAENTELTVWVVDTDTRQLIGFARALSDLVYKAIIMDVIIKEGYRNKRIGRAIMAHILTHPKLAKVRHFELCCRPELVAYYQQWGFDKPRREVVFLRKESDA